MKWLVSLAAFALISLFGAPAPAYLLELQGDPAAVRAVRQSPKADLSQKRALAARYRDAVLAEQNKVRRSLAERGIEVAASADTLLNALAVEGENLSIADLRAIPGVVRVTKLPVYKATLDHALPLAKAYEAWDLVGGPDKAGAGVKIAMIDSGLDTSHPGFQDASMSAPEGFPKFTRETDKASTNGKVIVYRTYKSRASAPEPATTDQAGHGTFTSMIAAGMQHAAPRGTISGMAPKAWIGMYKVAPENPTGGALSGTFILQAMDDAARDGMDIINMSLGSYPAPRIEYDPFRRLMENANALGIILVAAAGNDGPDMNTLGTPATLPSVIAVGNTSSDRVFAAPVKTSDGRIYASVPGSGANSAQAITAQVVDVATLDGTGQACAPLPPDSLKGKIALILRRPCTFVEKLFTAEVAGAVAAIIYTIPELPEADFVMSTDTAALPATLLSNADGVDLKSRIAADPSTTVTVDFTTSSVPIDSRSMNKSSSRGPSPEYLIRPEISAVGSNIYSADPARTYTVSSGTSASAPLVAGAAAIVKAARPGLSADQYRSLLVNSADGFTNTADQLLEVQSAGAGRLNVRNALKSTIAAVPSALSFGVEGITAEISADLSLTNLATAADTYSLSVVPISGNRGPELSSNVLEVGAGKTGTLSLKWKVAGFEAGAYQGVILVSGSQSDVIARVPYWYAVPSKKAKSLTVIDSPTSATVNTDTFIEVRGTDAAGIPVNTPPVVEITEGTAAVRAINSIDYEYVGVWDIVIRMPRTVGQNVVKVTMGDQSVEIPITATR